MSPNKMIQNNAFKEYSKRMFRILLGISENSFDALVDWGGKTNKPIFIPISDLSLTNPIIGVKEKMPFVLLSETEIATIEFTKGIHFNFDVIQSTGWLLSGYEEILNNEIRDEFGRWDEKNSLVSNNGLTNIPAINIWIDIITQFFEKNNIEYVKPWPNNKKYSVVLSHDVDNPEYLIYNHFRNLLKNVFSKDKKIRNHLIMKFFGSIIIKSVDLLRLSFKKGIKEVLKVENYYKVNSTYFFSSILQKSDYRNYNDPNYEVKDKLISKSILKLQENGFNIGLHPAINTAPYTKRYFEQKKELESIAKGCVNSVRHHYWNISRKDTSDALLAISKSGFKTDSSLSFYHKPNFRRSIAFPFTPFHINKNIEIPILEIPCTFMDNWVNKSDPGKLVMNHIDMIKRFNGMAVLNWHVNRFNNFYFNKEKTAYKIVLQKLKKDKDVWLANIEEVKDWWLRRIEIIESSSKINTKI